MTGYVRVSRKSNEMTSCSTNIFRSRPNTLWIKWSNTYDRIFGGIVFMLNETCLEESNIDLFESKLFKYSLSYQIFEDL